MPNAARYARQKAAALARGTTPYKERVRRGEERGFTRRQAAGHPGRDHRSVREIEAERNWRTPVLTRGAEGQIEVSDRRLTYQESRRAARWNVYVRQLRDGEITPEQFRRAADRLKPIAGRKPLSDPAAVLEFERANEGEDGEQTWFRYVSGFPR